MEQTFRFDDEFHPVPPTAIDADPAATIRELFYRVGKLERSLEEQRTQSIIDWQETILALLSASDDITNTVNRWGVTTNGQEAVVIRNMVGVGRKLLAILNRHQVNPIEAIGKPLDAETSDVVGREVRDKVPPNTVLREEQTGYTWPQGLLRRARVVVSISGSEKGVGESAGDVTVMGSRGSS